MSRPELSPSELAAEWNVAGKRWSEILNIEDQARRGEIRGFDRRRGKSQYEVCLLGISHIFDYFRYVPGNRLVVDVGTGTGKGIGRISQNPLLSKDLDFMATGLTLDPALWRHINPTRFRRTPIERMKGFLDNSVVGMLGVNSIAYSASPKLAVARIDDLLVPGGGIKATFRRFEKGISGRPSDLMERHDKFSEQFDALGYDVAVTENVTDELDLDVLLAIKPGNTGIKAAELLERDKADYLKDWEEIDEILRKLD